MSTILNFMLEGKMKTNGYVHQLNSYEFDFRRQIMFHWNGYVELLYLQSNMVNKARNDQIGENKERVSIPYASFVFFLKAAFKQRANSDGEIMLKNFGNIEGPEEAFLICLATF